MRQWWKRRTCQRWHYGNERDRRIRSSIEWARRTHHARLCSFGSITCAASACMLFSFLTLSACCCSCWSNASDMTKADVRNERQWQNDSSCLLAERLTQLAACVASCRIRKAILLHHSIAGHTPTVRHSEGQQMRDGPRPTGPLSRIRGHVWWK